MKREPTVQDFVSLCYRFLAAELHCEWVRPKPTSSGVAEQIVAACLAEPPRNASVEEHRRVFARCASLARMEYQRAIEARMQA
jgi:hypothetical protein